MCFSANDRVGNVSYVKSDEITGIDTTDPGISFPASPAKPQVGVASTITLTDANAKIKKYGAIMVDGTTGAATDCDTAAEIGTSNLTTRTTPKASVNFAYTVPANSVGKKVCAYAEDAAGNIKSALWSAAAEAAPAGPAVSSIAITSTVPSNQDGKYRIGDAIAVTLTFDKIIVVTGTPKLEITVGTAGKSASCARKGNSGDNRKRLECTYTVAEGDADANGISVATGKLTLPTTPAASIKDGSNRDATFSYTAVADSAGHKVDGVKPTVTQASTGYFSNAAATTALAGPVKGGTSVYTKVTFSEDMKHVKSNAAAARPQLFRRIGTTDTQYDILNNDDTLANGDCKPSHATNTNVYVCLYTVGSSVNGEFRVKVGTASADKATNALASVYNHAATLTLDTTKPGIAFPASPAKPQAGAASTITLTDAGAKIKKHGAIAVTSPGAATDCDTATEIGTSNLTTLTTPAASVNFAYTVPAGSAGKRVCAYAEDAAGNIRSQVWGEDIQAAATVPAKPTGLSATAGDAQVSLSWTDPSDSTITKYQYRQRAGSAAWGSWTDISGSGATTTSHTVTSLNNGTEYRFRIRAVNAQGNSPESDVAGPATPSASDTTGPTVTGIAITSTVPANQDGKYRIGDVVKVTVTFNEAIALTGSPTLKIKVGTAEKSATCAKKGTTGDAAKKLECSYTVAEGDEDTDGIAVEAGKLAGTIKDGSDNAATLTYTAITAQSSHKVDGVKPTVTQASTGYFTTAAANTALTGPLRSGTDIYTKVTFSEDMKHVKSNAAAARPQLFYRIGSADTQYDILNSDDTLNHGDCKPSHATNTNVYVCRGTQWTRRSTGRSG